MLYDQHYITWSLTISDPPSRSLLASMLLTYTGDPCNISLKQKQKKKSEI